MTRGSFAVLRTYQKLSALPLGGPVDSGLLVLGALVGDLVFEPYGFPTPDLLYASRRQLCTCTPSKGGHRTNSATTTSSRREI